MRTILVIDSDQVFRDILVDILESEKYIVMSSQDGTIGLQQALALLPDLIICEVNLLGIDGYSILEELRNNSQTQHIPFIFLSILTSRFNQRKGIELGANRFLIKPISIETLLTAISDCLNKKN